MNLYARKEERNITDFFGNHLAVKNLLSQIMIPSEKSKELINELYGIGEYSISYEKWAEQNAVKIHAIRGFELRGALDTTVNIFFPNIIIYTRPRNIS